MAQFHKNLKADLITHVVRKGQDPLVDSYSAFFDNARLHTTELADYLQKAGVSELWVMGIATDYCVKFSCLDAISCGFKVNLLLDACRGVELSKGDCERAVHEMKLAGVKIQSIKSLGVLI